MTLVTNILLWFIFIKSSFADSDDTYLDVKALQNDVGRIVSALQSLQETTRRQDELINDLLQRNNAQEKRLQELETALKIQNKSNRQDDRPKDKEIKHNPVSVEPRERTETDVVSLGYTVQDKKQVRKERLLASMMPTTNPSYERGIVAFYARMSSDDQNPSAHHTLIFDNVHTNVGSGYNGITGIFTAPQEGIYVFTWVIRMVTAEHSTELMHNNDVLGATFLRAKNGDDGSVSGTVVTHLTKGDVVFVRNHSQYVGDGSIKSEIHGQPSFSGWLLH